MGASKKSPSPPGEATPVELTEAEWEIMKVVWEKEPCAAGTVQEELAGDRDRAYSTVKTTMDRMVEKGFLRIERIRNLQLFSSCVSEVEARRGEFRRMLKRAFDGALTPMMQFLIEHESNSSNRTARAAAASSIRNCIIGVSGPVEGRASIRRNSPRRASTSLTQDVNSCRLRIFSILRKPFSTMRSIVVLTVL